MEFSGDVDSALIAGMKDPRERAALFRLEHWYQDFCNSTSLWMEVGGAYNRCLFLGPPAAGEEQQQQVPMYQQQQMGGGHQTSFHRLLVHRLADRFAIRRESRNPYSIRLIKCPETSIPPILLKDLDPDVYYPSGPGNTVNSNNDNSAPSVDIAPSPPETSRTENVAVEKQQRKKVIMKKRSPNNGHNIVLQKKSLATQQSRSSDASDANSRQVEYAASRSSSSEQLEAKERAYAEARARIFNDSEGGDGTVVADASLSNDDDAPAASLANLSIQSDTDKNNYNSSPNSSNSNHNTNSNSEPASSDAVDRKAVYRNRAEEAADPDFRRGRIQHQHVVPVGNPAMVMAPMPYNNHPVYYANPGTPYGPPAVSPQAMAAPRAPLTASAPIFVPGGGGGAAPSYLAASARPQPQQWGSPTQKNGVKTPNMAMYDGQPRQQQPQGWYPSQQVHNPGAAARMSPRTQHAVFAQPPQGGKTMATVVATTPSATAPATTRGTNQTTSATVGVGPS